MVFNCLHQTDDSFLVRPLWYVKWNESFLLASSDLALVKACTSCHIFCNTLLHPLQQIKRSFSLKKHSYLVSCNIYYVLYNMTRAISLSKFLKWSHRITLFVNENELKLSKQPCFVARLKKLFLTNYTSLITHLWYFKGALSGLRQFLAIESALKIIKLLLISP